MKKISENTFGHPDSSGNRMGGSLQKSRQRGGDSYPYDNDKNMKGMGNGTSGRIPVPRDISSKEAQDAAWDELEKFGEAMGTPYFFQKAYSSQLGSSVPGGNSSAAWGKMPSHDWDENEMEDEIEKYGEGVNPPTAARPPDNDVLDPNVMSPWEEYFVSFPAAGTFMTGLGSQPNPLDLMAEPSVWPFLEKILRREKW